MKAFWERLTHYDLKLYVNYPELMVPWEGDVLLTTLFQHADAQGRQLHQLNCCQQHLEAMFLLDLSLADGCIFYRPMSLHTYMNQPHC